MCGKLYVDRVDLSKWAVGKCVQCGGKWYKLSEFEILGGKRDKKWRQSLFHLGKCLCEYNLFIIIVWLWSQQRYYCEIVVRVACLVLDLCFIIDSILISEVNLMLILMTCYKYFSVLILLIIFHLYIVRLLKLPPLALHPIAEQWSPIQQFPNIFYWASQTSFCSLSQLQRVALLQLCLLEDSLLCQVNLHHCMLTISRLVQLCYLRIIPLVESWIWSGLG